MITAQWDGLPNRYLNAYGVEPPSLLEATKYLNSLHNAVWERSSRIEGVPLEEQNEIEKSHQLSIRRARLGVEILKRPSDDQTKFDLFQRLNAGGTQANAQELRNCIIIMVNKQYFEAIRQSAEDPVFRRVITVTEDQLERQRHMEYAVRFLVHTLVKYDGKLDVEEYIDEGIVSLATSGNATGASSLIKQTFALLDEVAGSNALRRIENGNHIGKVGLVGLEGIAVGVARNLERILKLRSPAAYIKRKIKGFWSNPATESFTSLGLRGTTRIQRTVPFGEAWFKP
ncbi:MAG: hypothetical protein WBE76_03955 [Terracidiphilus sp.]